MSIFRKSVLSILFVLIVLTQACSPTPTRQIMPAPTLQAQVDHPIMAGIGIPGDGNVIALGLLDMCRYLMTVFQGQAGTFIMRSPAGDFLFAWPMQSNA